VAAVVNVADALARFIDDQSNGSGHPADEAAPEALNLLKLSPDQVLHYRDRTVENFEFVNALCRL
jgi:hypothetical protein